jgi:hypothetical protein
MRRIVMMLALMGAAPLLLGAGGAAPGVPSGNRVGGPTYQVAVVVDPHAAADDFANALGTDVTSRAKQASIRLYLNTRTTGALFDIPRLGFPLFRGCDLALTDDRFRYVPLANWIPAAVLTELFEQLGEPIGPAYTPVITRILQASCTDDPANPGPIADGGDGQPSEPGILSFNAQVRFLIPQ